MAIPFFYQRHFWLSERTAHACIVNSGLDIGKSHQEWLSIRESLRTFLPYGNSGRYFAQKGTFQILTELGRLSIFCEKIALSCLSTAIWVQLSYIWAIVTHFFAYLSVLFALSKCCSCMSKKPRSGVYHLTNRILQVHNHCRTQHFQLERDPATCFCAP